MRTIEYPQPMNWLFLDHKQNEWRDAMQDEISRIEKKNTWKLVPCPPNTTTIKGKWVYVNKLDENLKLLRRRARLVAKRYK